MSKNKIVLGVVAILIIVGIIITSRFNMKSQDTPPKINEKVVQLADVEEPIKVIFTPQNQIVPRDTEFLVEVTLESGELAVTGIDITLPIDTESVDFVSFTPNDSLNTHLINEFDATNKSFRYSAVNTLTEEIKGTIKIGELKLQAKTIGQGSLAPSKSQITASRYDKAIPIETMPGAYSITD